MNETIKRLYVTGYQSYELGIFNEKDPRVQVIKNVLKRELTALIENGLEWVMISGSLGTEAWTGQVVNELKVDYPELRLAIIFPFENFGSNWKEQNQLIL
ncbi:MAG: SLOG family protein, partial [Enterococcus sp.]|nr:SLOG family protein [Enterococcus sp.]